MRVTYDPQADMLGVWLDESREPCEAKEIAPGVRVDLAEDGTLLALEVEDAASRYPADLLEQVSFDRLVPLAEAAQAYGLSPGRLRSLVKSGQLHAKKRGRRWLATPGWVKDYLEGQ